MTIQKVNIQDIQFPGAELFMKKLRLLMDDLRAVPRALNAAIDLTERLNWTLATHDLQAPLTGFSITVANSVGSLLLQPAGVLATGTIIMPSSPYDGQRFTASSSTAITALTVSAAAGHTILNAPTTLAAGGFFTYQYVTSSRTWYRIG